MTTGSAISDSVLAGIVVAVLVSLFKGAGRIMMQCIKYLSLLDTQVALRLAKRQLAHLNDFSGDSSKAVHFGIAQLFTWLSVLSADLMFSSLSMFGNAVIVGPIIFGLRGCLYLIALYTCAVIQWSRNRAKYAPMLEDRIKVLEARAAAKQTRDARRA